MKLTAKQERFVSEYLIDLNATQAAIRAGYSEKTAQEQSSRLLSNVMVQQAVSDAQNRVAEKAEWSAADRLRMLASMNPTDNYQFLVMGALGLEIRADFNGKSGVFYSTQVN